MYFVYTHIDYQCIYIYQNFISIVWIRVKKRKKNALPCFREIFSLHLVKFIQVDS